MATKLTRAELNDKLDWLRGRAAEISREVTEGEQAEAVAGEAEVIEQFVAAPDWIYFHQQVEAIIRKAGMVEPEEDDE